MVVLLGLLLLLAILFALLLELKRIETPVRYIPQDHLVTHMMLHGHGIDPTRR